MNSTVKRVLKASCPANTHVLTLVLGRLSGFGLLIAFQFVAPHIADRISPIAFLDIVKRPSVMMPIPDVGPNENTQAFLQVESVLGTPFGKPMDVHLYSTSLPDNEPRRHVNVSGSSPRDAVLLHAQRSGGKHKARALLWLDASERIACMQEHETRDIACIIQTLNQRRADQLKTSAPKSDRPASQRADARSA